MSKLPPFRSARVARALLLVVLPVLSIESALASGIGESFRSFVLGPEARASTRVPGLDAASQACMACHDGLRAPHVIARTTGSPMPIRGSQTLNHPVGMEYDRSIAKDPQGYRPRHALPSKIRLVDGQVGCVSCHETRNDLTLAAAGDTLPPLASASTCTATRQLTTGRRDRDLCLACHNK